jgi:hypothetical protein
MIPRCAKGKAFEHYQIFKRSEQKSVRGEKRMNKHEEKSHANKRGRPAKKKEEPAKKDELADQPKQKAEPTSSSKKSERSIRDNAPAENYFVLCNGQPVRNVKELADVLDNLEEHVFNHHVRPDHNDFTAWIADIFHDAELAQKLADVKDRQHMQLVLYKHIAHKLW